MIGGIWLAVRGALFGNASLSIIGMVLGVIAAGGIGATWLRHSAASGALLRYEQQLANARIQIYARDQSRQRNSEAIAQKRAADLAAERDAQAKQIGELEAQLRDRPRTVCYPKDIARRLNQ